MCLTNVSTRVPWGMIGYCSGVSFNLTMLVFCTGNLLNSTQRISPLM